MTDTITNDTDILEISHKIEDFILHEIDYSKENGYSSRARRYMKRKLNKELEEFFHENKKMKSLPDYESEYIDRERCNLCYSVMIFSTIFTFYTMFGFIIYRYQSCLLPPL